MVRERKQMSFEKIRPLIGTWRLVDTKAVDDEGNPMRPPYGPRPQGIVTFSADGRMMAVLCDGRTQLPPDEPVREYNSYCGNFTFDGDTLVTRVDGSSNAGWVGGAQVRVARFDGHRLILVPPPRPWQGVNQHRTLVWERMGEAG
jgi:Lipocalin-like domain